MGDIRLTAPALSSAVGQGSGVMLAGDIGRRARDGGVGGGSLCPLPITIKSAYSLTGAGVFGPSGVTLLTNDAKR